MNVYDWKNHSKTGQKIANAFPLTPFDGVSKYVGSVPINKN
jgi:hypothetical protein